MKKLIAFLLTIIMLIGVAGCGIIPQPSDIPSQAESEIADTAAQTETKPATNDFDIASDVFCHTEELQDRAAVERVFGSRGEWWADDEYFVEDYELHGVTGELCFEYDDDVFGIYFTADFWGEDRVSREEMSQTGVSSCPSAEQSRAAEQYYADIRSYYKENGWGEPTETDHELTVWLFDTTGDDSFFTIECDSDDATVDIAFSLDGVRLD